MQSTMPSWPKFQTKKPRILLLTSQYFLMGEVVAACKRLELPNQLLDLNTKEATLDGFMRMVLGALISFKPDFVLTVNHLGVDHEGVLAAILDKFDIPLASWFVDNPALILPQHEFLLLPDTAVFTWDSDNMDYLRRQGFPNVFHLPLAADTERFKPGAAKSDPGWEARISFVGNSMLAKTEKRLEAAMPGPVLAEKFRDLAEAFGNSREHSVRDFMHKEFPELADEYEALETPARKLAFETLVTWQSTLDYRLSCIEEILPFDPLVVGDPGWKELLPEHGGWRYHPELSYYDDLPGFYPRSEINFNCTSLQMKGAVNQRVFDVPSCGAFLLTDHREQMEKLFEPGTEIAFYNDPEEIPGLVEKYQNDAEARKSIAEAGRKRVLADHTYDKRMETLVDIMRQTFG